MPRLAIFIDDGGVMNDNHLRAPQWQRLVGEFLAPRLGGAPAAWERANRNFTNALFASAAMDRRIAVAEGWTDFDRAYKIDWLRDMCEIVGVPTPTVDDCVDIAEQANRYIIPQVRSAYPGAAETILTLKAAGYQLFTASGEASDDLNDYLSGMGDGVREAFTRLYGPDLVNVIKTGPDFYRKVFSDSGVDPESALVVDDSPRAIGWALEAGARAVLVGEAPAPRGQLQTNRIRWLADLPTWLENLSPPNPDRGRLGDEEG